ncbi:Wadjet anti-phage system protein JetD domain-containing protein [Sphaerisporangium rhizosphaerae]|uniref:Wadjet anti-phage system protein JetD domain-containing protein n=1 Tax=Sphaerisporangium rhizosphaerae TaxID=2269375 RepID=A0ABW2PIR4_9ACTN
MRHLTATERVLYEHLTDPDWTRFLRIEQERIPLRIAADAVDAGTRETSIQRRESV